MLARDGIQRSTRKNYGDHYPYWVAFCDWYEIDVDDLNVSNSLDFLAWAYRKTSLNASQVDKVLTSVASVLKDKGETFNRKDFPTIRRHLDGYRFHRPPAKRKKLPICNILINYFFQFCIDFRKYNDVINGIGCLLGHDLGLRPGEYTFKQTSPQKLLRLQHIRFTPNKHNPKEITIIIPFSKTNPHNDKLELVHTECVCVYKGFKTLERPCLVHLVLHYFKMRFHWFNNNPLLLKEPFLLLKNKKHYRFDHIRNFIWNAILIINKRKKLQLNPEVYTPHALRVGGCTDKAREGYPGWYLEKWGRWSTNIWKRTYINLDWRDLAILHNKTISELTSNIANKPYVK